MITYSKVPEVTGKKDKMFGRIFRDVYKRQVLRSMREKDLARHREQALREVLALRFFLDLITWSLNPA